MEVWLALYKLPYDPNYPVVCYDERPCFLIGETVAPLVMRSGRVRKEHYAYEKLGSCALLAMIEPLTGERLAQVHPQRTKKEYTLFCQAIAAKYPNAIKIRMVQDNLNTHDASAFYENLPADEALALAERFEFYYTPRLWCINRLFEDAIPNSGSFSAISQCFVGETSQNFTENWL